MEFITFITGEMGQEIFNPPDVAGWSGQRAWINENTLTLRWGQIQNFRFNTMGGNGDTRNLLRQFAINLTDNSDDVEFVTLKIARHFLNTEPSPENLETAIQYMKEEIPENYFTNGIWNLFYPEAPDQIINLLFYLTRLPEWQLN